MTQSPARSALRRTFKYVGVALAAAVVIGIAWVVRENARGRDAVLELCTTKGGLHIEESVEAEGYLDLTAARSCAACMEWLGQGQYSYVDFFDERPMLSERPGYQRMTVTSRGDPKCAAYEDAVQRRLIQPREEYGLRTDQCFVVEPLDERPVGFVYDRRSGTLVAPNGATVGFNELFVADERDGRELAASRNYGYQVPLAGWFDMSGGGGTAHESCARTAGILPVYAFIDRVLLKKSQSPLSDGDVQ